MDSKIIIYLLAKLKKDYLEWHIYREDTIKSCIYYHLKNYYGEQVDKYLYTEVRNIKKVNWLEKIDKDNWRQRFDLVISKKPLFNGEKVTDIAWYSSIESIIEIKYILWTLYNIEKSLEIDSKKLNDIKDIESICNSSKNVFFIWEHTETTNWDLRELKRFLSTKKRSQLNIFWLLFSYKKWENEKVDDWYYINNQKKEIFTKKLR